MMIRAVLLILALAVPSGALAQSPELQAQAQESVISDHPPGYPYNTGQAYESTQVPLRDFFSSRLDQNRVEFLDRLGQVAAQQRDIIDERDRQYAQRFAAQQEALSAALLAAEKAVANALAAAKEAVIKAENAANDRFDGVNEMRGQLDDQARNFVTKDTFEAKFEAIETKIGLAMDVIATISRRLDTMASKEEGATDTWALIGAGILLVIAIGSFAMAYNKHKAAA